MESRGTSPRQSRQHYYRQLRISATTMFDEGIVYVHIRQIRRHLSIDAWKGPIMTRFGCVLKTRPKKAPSNLPKQSRNNNGSDQYHNYSDDRLC